MIQFSVHEYMRRMRKLRRRKRITPADYSVIETLVCSFGLKGRNEAQVGYVAMADAAGVGRKTAWKAVCKLRALKVLAVRQTRVRVPWRGGFASRQGRNIYTFLMPATEFPEAPANQRSVRKKEAHEVGSWFRSPQTGPIGDPLVAQKALLAIAEARQRQLSLDWLAARKA